MKIWKWKKNMFRQFLLGDCRAEKLTYGPSSFKKFSRAEATYFRKWMLIKMWKHRVKGKVTGAEGQRRYFETRREDAENKITIIGGTDLQSGETTIRVLLRGLTPVLFPGKCNGPDVPLTSRGGTKRVFCHRRVI